MAMKRFVEILEKQIDQEYFGIDCIPGTSKVRTYCSNPLVFSAESDIRKISSKRYLEIDTSTKI